MKSFFIFAVSIFLSTNFTFSQEYKGAFAIINDADGYTNIRDKSKRLIDKVSDFEVIAINDFCDSPNNYMCVDYG